MSKERPTEPEMRERIEEIAIEAYVDTPDASEPLDQLIPRVRAGLDQELENISTLFQDFHAELDEFDDVIAEQQPPRVGDSKCPTPPRPRHGARRAPSITQNP